MSWIRWSPPPSISLRIRELLLPHTPRLSILLRHSITSHALVEEELDHHHHVFLAAPPSAAAAPSSSLLYDSNTQLKHLVTSGNLDGGAAPSSSLMYDSNTQLKHLVTSGNLANARSMFDRMPHRDEISWTTIISGYVTASDPAGALLLFSRMRADPSLATDPFVLSLALKASASGRLRRHGESLHAYATKSGLVASSVFVGSALLDMYAKTGFLSSSLRVFGEMRMKNVVSWTAVITALVSAGRCDEAIRCFAEMWASRVACDSHTLAVALKACAGAGRLDRGREIHAQAVKCGLDAASFVANSLSTMYSKCGRPDRGFLLFDRMRTRDVVSWTAVISAHVRAGRHEDAVRAFVEMARPEEEDAGGGVSPNEYTYAAVISACAGLGRVEWGEQLQARVTRAGLAGSASVANAVVTMYSSAGRLDSAAAVFHEMETRDVVSWSAIIAGYAQEGYVEDALRLFTEMRHAGTAPNEFTLASLISSCAYAATLEQGRQLHTHAMAAGLDGDVMVRSALINMYAKSGSIGEARRVFDDMAEGGEDVVSWTAMINGYAEHGCSEEAIGLFERMQSVKLWPDRVAFIGVLCACSHAGLVDLGLQYFSSMRAVYGIKPGKEHYGLMVDLLARAGRVEEAERVAECMPCWPDDVVWSTLLRACRVHGDTKIGRRAAERILELQPNCAGTHVTLSNIYAAKGRWRDAAEIRKLMRSKGVIKEPGWSWITVGENVSVFVAGDRRHPEGELIYAMLELLASWVKIAGYVPEITLLESDDGE